MRVPLDDGVLLSVLWPTTPRDYHCRAVGSGEFRGIASPPSPININGGPHHHSGSLRPQPTPDTSSGSLRLGIRAGDTGTPVVRLCGERVSEM